jgi:hypothetical protein
MEHQVVEEPAKESQISTAKTDKLEAKWARERREDLWILTAVCASINGSRDAGELAEFADRVLKEFDDRFPRPQV